MHLAEVGAADLTLDPSPGGRGKAPPFSPGEKGRGRGGATMHLAEVGAADLTLDPSPGGRGKATPFCLREKGWG